ncbi:N(G),N(G)-dimethylarginine dimethylaminohydrolase 1-like [Argonauta hians]
MSFEYNRALMRPVTEGLIDKIKSRDPSIKLNFAALQREQNKLAEILKKRKISVTNISPDPSYPEGCFIEDCAVIIGETALICRPADQSRRGEVGIVRKYLEREINLRVQDLKDPSALLDGGDVLFTGKEIFVGVGHNTNEAGAIAVARLYEDYSVILLTLTSKLHLKNLISMAGRGVVVIGNSPESKLLFRQIKERTSNTYFKIEFDSDVPASVLFANGTLIHRSRDEMGINNCSTLDEKIGYDREEVELREFDKISRTLSSLCLLVNRVKTTRQIMSDINDEDINSYSTLTRKNKDYYK